VRSSRIFVLVLMTVFAACEDPPEPIPQAPVGIEVGYRTPALSGTRADGVPFVLESEPPAPTVLIFYRSAQCGLCRRQLDQTQTHLDAYDYAGARVVGITLDAPDLSQQLQEAGIGFSLVSVDPEVFEAWGAMHPDLGTPMPATFIVDTQGVIRFKHLGRNAADRTTDAGILTVLEILTSQ
jgi:peroxiredoxin